MRHPRAVILRPQEDAGGERAKECPKSSRMLATTPGETPRGCARCGRWQYLYQATFVEFEGAVFRHLACVACGQGAWCRDFVEGGPEASDCAYRTHVHWPGQCPNALRR